MGTASPEQPSRGKAGEEDDEMLRQRPDQVLQEQLQRLDGLDSRITRRLPDGGEKYRRLLDATRRELARRKAARSAPPPPSSQPPPPRPHGRQGDPDADRCERVVRSRCAESSDLASDSNENHGLTKFDFLSSFEMNEEAGIDVSCPEITSTGPGKPKTSVQNERKLYEADESCKPAAQPTDLSHKVSCIDNSANMENMSAGDDCKDNGHNRICNHAPSPSRKRKGDASVAFSMRLRSRKVQEVVLLDGDAHHSESAEKASTKGNAMKIYYPSREHPDSVELSHDDIKCLKPESLLSSPIMNFYIMYLQGPMSSITRLRGKYHIFNTYFFSKLEDLKLKVDKDAYFLKLRRWWKSVDIFQKAYILLPVHAEFLKEEWNYLNKNGPLAEFPIQEIAWKNLPRKIEKKSIAVPQQENEYDCGIFVLYYMQRFLEEAPDRLHKEELSMFGKGWFKPEEASALRKEMQTLLLQLFEEAKPENNTTEPTMSEHPLEGSSADTASPGPLEGTSTEPTTFEHPLECS